MFGKVKIGRLHMRRRYLCGAAANALVLGLVTVPAGMVLAPHGAYAQQATAVAFNIPAQDLNSAILSFAQKAGVRVFYDTAKFRGQRSSAVSGTMTAPEALGRLLQGTGLSYRFNGPGRVTISAPQAAAVGGGVVGDSIQLAPLNVEGDGVSGYVATASRAATKTDTPLIEIPQSVSVVTREELTDRNVQTLTEAVAYTPGVRTGQSGFDPRYDSFTIRGFDVTYNGIYRDGLRLPGANMSVFKVEPYGVESVTILRGPVSALYGLGSPGGLVDIVSKRPVATPFGEVEVQAGNYDWWQGQADIGGKLDEEGKWLYRITGVLRDAGAPNVQGGGVNDMRYIAPALTWQPNADTRITFLGEYLDSETPASMPYYAWTGAANPSFSESIGDYNSLKQSQYRLGYQAEHDINDVLTVRQNLRYGEIDTQVRYNGITGRDMNTLTASRYTGFVHDDVTSFVVDNQVQADFSTGPVDHVVLVGLDYSYLTLEGGIGYGGASDISLINNMPLGPTFDPQLTASRYKQRQSQTGVYLQEQAKLGGWVLTLTGRQDWVQTHSDDFLAGTSEDVHDSAFTGRAGLTYVLENGIAPYVSYATSFAPNLGVDQWGNTFQPTTARQVEAGIKYEPTGFDGYFTVSLFQINQDNGLVTDDINPYYQVQRGEVRGRGVELSVVANLTAGLKMRGAYTYLDMRNMSGETATVGLTPSGTPEHSFSIWADYQFQPESQLAGLGVGAGVRYVGATWGNSLNTFQNSAYTLLDAKLSYDFSVLNPDLKGWSAQVNAQNLLDDSYITCDAGYCYKGTPRTVLGGLKYKW
ncbi:MAG: TonB-dependent siderophore receptor [Xanthobacter sp.]